MSSLGTRGHATLTNSLFCKPLSYRDKMSCGQWQSERTWLMLAAACLSFSATATRAWCTLTTPNPLYAYHYFPAYTVVNVESFQFSWSPSILIRLKWNTLFEFLNQNPLPLGVCHLPTGSRLVLHVRRHVMVIPRSGEQSHQVWVRHWSTEAVENRDFNCGLQRTQKTQPSRLDHSG